MKDSAVLAHLDCALLRYVRDGRPSEADLRAWLGPTRQTTYYTLRRASLLLVDAGRVVLSPAHQGDAGRTFRFADHVYRLDDDVVMVVRRGPTAS